MCFSLGIGKGIDFQRGSKGLSAGGGVLNSMAKTQQMRLHQVLGLGVFEYSRHALAKLAFAIAQDMFLDNGPFHLGYCLDDQKVSERPTFTSMKRHFSMVCAWDALEPECHCSRTECGRLVPSG